MLFRSRETDSVTEAVSDGLLVTLGDTEEGGVSDAEGEAVAVELEVAEEEEVTEGLGLTEGVRLLEAEGRDCKRTEKLPSPTS